MHLDVLCLSVLLLSVLHLSVLRSSSYLSCENDFVTSHVTNYITNHVTSLTVWFIHYEMTNALKARFPCNCRVMQLVTLLLLDWQLY